MNLIIPRRILLSLLAIVLTSAVSAHVAFAQLDNVDATFQPVPSTPPVAPAMGGVAKGQVLQSDGKLIIWGGDLAIRGKAKGQVARLNADGSLDNSFGYCSCQMKTVSNVIVQPDGKILVSGSDETSGRGRLVRLFTDGSVDNSFDAALAPNTPTLFVSGYVWLVRADGKIYAHVEANYGNVGVLAIRRLNPDGGLDNTFTPINYNSGLGTHVFPTDLVENGDKIYISSTTEGMQTGGDLKRFNLDGTLDSGWQRPTFTGGPPGVAIRDFDFQADGSILVAGRFGSVNGFAKPNLARVLPAGNVDLTYIAPVVTEVRYVTVLPDGKALVSYDAGGGRDQFYRLKTDGSIDSTFTHPASLGATKSRWVLDSMQRIYFYGTDVKYHRLNPNGDVDESFAPGVSDFGKIYAIAPQADGKVILAGDFTQMNGEARVSIARVNQDGTLDMSFNSGTGFNAIPSKVLVQSDGKILVTGQFTNYNGVSVGSLARLNSDGSLDGPFAPAIDEVASIVLQPDGKILVGGFFTSVNGTPRSYLARLLSDGMIDSTFGAIVSREVVDIALQPDGKVLIAGGFAGVNGFNRPNLARLNTDGTLDQGFNATPGPGFVSNVALQPDGKILISNASETVITRRNADGSSDSSFQVNLDNPNSSFTEIDAIVVNSDGSFFVGGQFNSVNGLQRRNLTRIQRDGALDQLFLPNGANRWVHTAVKDAAGRLLIGGEFSLVKDSARAGVARLLASNVVRATPFDFDGDGRGDIAVYRPSSNRWYEVVSSTGGVVEETFGVAGDILAPADFDGDGITDEAVFRPSAGTWWYKSSISGVQISRQFGAAGDIPRPSDFDGDGRADLVLFRPSNSTWYRANFSGNVSFLTFGISGDQPLVGDFDGDGKSDYAIFRPSTGDWWYAASSAGNAFRQSHWGQNGDIPVPADFDGDGKTDFAIFRPSDGGWYIYNSGNGSFTIMQFGTNGDRPVAADYDGDGRADVAVFRPSTGIWYLFRSTAGFAGYQFGISTDTAIPGSLIP